VNAASPHVLQATFGGNLAEMAAGESDDPQPLTGQPGQRGRHAGSVPSRKVISTC
jgi:hypothetical protein